jgi:hypothetical protein
MPFSDPGHHPLACSDGRGAPYRFARKGESSNYRNLLWLVALTSGVLSASRVDRWFRPPHADPLHAMDGMLWRTPLLRAFAAGQGQSTTTRWAPLLSLAVPCCMPQTCPKGAAGL